MLPIQANIGLVSNVHEGLVEPSYSSNFPNHLLVARSLSEVGPSQEVLTQMVNISPESKKLYKGTKIGEFIPWNHINLVQDWESDISPPAFENADVGLAHCDLPPSEKGQLMELIHEFRDLFASQNCKLGCTSIVKHEIRTEGHPIRQAGARGHLLLLWCVKKMILGGFVLISGN